MGGLYAARGARLEVLRGAIPPGADSPAEEPSTHFGTTPAGIVACMTPPRC
ncbi:MAG TPA: hypothetical protein VHB02_03005 [Acidimicrobiales bacterium]|nr:hypothetical protein [Acidimicrobiales bacterium]